MEEWQHNVAELAEGNDNLIFAICYALAPVFVGPCGAESGGLHGFGRSTRGKTIWLIVAGSVWGGGQGKQTYHVQWRATSNGIEGIAVRHSGVLLSLDDISQAQPKEVANVVYMLGNDQGKQRANKEGSARKVAEWQLLWLSTGEKSIADTIAEGQTKSTGGQQVRCIDLRITDGEFGVFDNIHEFPSPREFADKLKTAAKTYYGTAGRHFVETVAPYLEKHAKTVRNRVQAFVEDNCPDGADDQIRRVAAHFGLGYAVGRLACELDTLPWDPEIVETVFIAKFEKWLKQRGSTGATEDDAGILALRTYLDAHRFDRFDTPWEVENKLAIIQEVGDTTGAPILKKDLLGSVSGEAIKTKTNPKADKAADALTVDSLFRQQPRIYDLAGYRKRVNGDDWEFYITRTAWTKITAGYNSEELCQTLVDKGYLLGVKKGHFTRQMRVPNVAGRDRYYHISHTFFDADDD